MIDHSPLVWDNHVCLPLRPHDQEFLPELERHRAAGTHVVMINVGYGHDSVEQHVRMLATFRGWIAAHADRFRLIESVDDISRARAAGQLAVGFDIEGADAIDDQLSLVGLYRDLGVRWMLLAYNRNNRAAGGCQDEDCGLTAFGRRLLEELAAQGVVACCSHTGYRTARAAIDASPTPVIFSHSNPRALADHPRNIPDDLIVACAGRGGVIGINGIGLFLGDNDASPSRMALAAAHVADLVGPQHVGIGLDFMHDRSELDQVSAANPAQFPSELGYGTGMVFVAPEGIPEIARELRSLGMSADDVACVLGGNWLRIARQVWKR